MCAFWRVTTGKKETMMRGERREPLRSRAQEAAKAKIVANIRESLADCKVCDLSYLTEEAEKSGFGKLRDCLKEAIYTSHPECFFGRGYERLPHILGIFD